MNSFLIEMLTRNTEFNIMLNEIKRDMQINRAETDRELAHNKFRIETAIKDQNDKINAILDYLGATISKDEPRKNIYTVEKAK